MVSRTIDSYDPKELIALKFSDEDALDTFLYLLHDNFPDVDYELPWIPMAVIPRERGDDIKKSATSAGLDFQETRVLSPTDLSRDKYHELQRSRFKHNGRQAVG